MNRILDNQPLKEAVKRTLYTFSIPFYQMTCSKESGYTFFLIQKTGISTVLSVLRDATQLDCDEQTKLYLKSRHRNRFKFCFIRNPWDKLVSCYSNKVLRQKLFPECWGKDFSYFINFLTRQHLPTAEGHIRLQTCSFPVKDIDYIGRFERFEQDFDYIINQKLGLHREPIQLNPSKHKHYTEYYTEETRRIVEEIYRPDIELGNYRFEQ